MECELCPENGPSCSKTTNEGRGLRNFKYNGYVGGSGLRLGFPISVLGEPPNRQMYLSAVPTERAFCQDTNNHVPADPPFMNNMDEISYWIYSKRAPCLMNYDNLIKRQNEEAQNSKAKPKIVTNNVEEVPSPKKKKKRKLSSINDSISDNIKKNIYFKTSQKEPHKLAMNSDVIGSDIDFNIKNCSMQGKPKKSKLQKNDTNLLTKQCKMVTSTPKVTNLRRSLRQKKQCINNGHTNTSLNIDSSGVVNGNKLVSYVTLEDNTNNKLEESAEVLASGDQNCEKKNSMAKTNVKNEIENGQFEDLSDVSGFTATYIRSTKVQSKKIPRKLRCKTSKNLINESRQNEQKDTMLVCINKTVNTRLSKNSLLNSSKETSQNAINLVTIKNNGNKSKINKSTSLLKFLDTAPKIDSLNDCKERNTQMTSESTSRYPKRSRNTKANNQTDNSKNISRNSSEFGQSDRIENPEEKLSKTRSGRSVGITLQQTENSVFILSNSTDKASSGISLNVASPNKKTKRKKRPAKRVLRTRKNRQLVQKDSVRDKSGFAACFSDSDDSLPLQKRYFCA